MATAVVRAPCPCRCGCTCSSADGLCWMCRRDVHSGGPALRAHAALGFEAWQQIVPTTRGSSGLSHKQLSGATDRWLAWHADTGCEWRPA